MFGGMDPKKMQAVMRQMGIKQEEIDASRVLIEKNDGGKIVIDNPSVVKIVVSGQESWQISGTAREEADGGIKQEDVALVQEKTGVNEAEARKALEESHGELASAIMALSG